MNAIQLLKHDHRTVDGLFHKFEALAKRDGSESKDTNKRDVDAEKRRIVVQIVKELSIHAAIEEAIFYPMVKAAALATDNEKIRDQILESLEEHHVVKWLLKELDTMKASEERFDAKVTVLIENVRHHVKEEEHDLFPRVEKLLNAQALDEMGVALNAAKTKVPTHPHPKAPDEPAATRIAEMKATMGPELHGHRHQPHAGQAKSNGHAHHR